MAGLLASVAGCPGRDNPIDTDEPTGPPPPPDLPELRLTSPERAAFLPGAVQVSGSATAGTGALAELTVDDAPVPLEASGGFSTTITPPPGLFLLGSRVVDDIGERAVDGRAVHVGPVHPPGASLPGAILVELGPPLLDDDDADPDDFAAVAARLVEDPAFSAPLVGRTFGDTIELTLTGMSVGGAEVDILPQLDVLWTDLLLTDLTTTFHWAYWGIDGSTYAEEATILVDLVVEDGPLGPTARAAAVDVDLDGFDWEIDWLPGGVESLLDSTVQEMQETSLEDQVATMVPELLASLLDAFAFDLPLGGTRVAIGLSVADLRSHPDGLVLELDASVVAPGGTVLPPGAGSLRTDAPPPRFPTGTWEPLTLAIDDDLVNQLLFAVWHGGALADFELSGTELILLTGEDLPPPLGPVASVTLDLGLPPVLSPTADLGDDGLFSADLSIGELWLDITRTDDAHVAVSLNLRAGTDLAIHDGALALDLDNRPTAMVVHAGMLDWPRALDPGDLASLFRLSSPGLVGGALDVLPGIPLPEIDLGELSEARSLDGVVWGVANAEATVQPSGWVVIVGEMR